LRPSASSRRKVAPDFYTVLLVIALVALLIATLFLWLYVKEYDYKTKPPPIAAAAAPADWAGLPGSGSHWAGEL
jgi:hypothetical protein